MPYRIGSNGLPECDTPSELEELVAYLRSHPTPGARVPPRVHDTRRGVGRESGGGRRGRAPDLPRPSGDSVARLQVNTVTWLVFERIARVGPQSRDQIWAWLRDVATPNTPTGRYREATAAWSLVNLEHRGHVERRPDGGYRITAAGWLHWTRAVELGLAEPIR